MSAKSLIVRLEAELAAEREKSARLSEYGEKADLECELWKAKLAAAERQRDEARALWHFDK